MTPAANNHFHIHRLFGASASV